jgi:hypothetical protein
MRRLALITLALVAAACHGSLKEPDASSGQLTGTGGSGGGTGGDAGTAVADGGPGGPPIVDVRPPDEPCSLEVRAMTVAGETCHFAIPDPPCSYVSRSRIGVRVDDMEIPYDPSEQDGWEYADSTQTTIRINGPSCDAVTGGAGVTIVYRVLLP